MSTQEVIDKYFKDERTIYFHQSDRHAAINGDSYLRYKKNGGIELWFGGSDGEVCVLFTVNAENLEAMIKLIMSA